MWPIHGYREGWSFHVGHRSENHMNTHSQSQPASAGSRLRRWRLSAGLALAAAAAVAAPAGAGAAPAVPGAEPVVVVPREAGYCGFPVQIAVLDGTKVRVNNGSVLSTGPLVAIVTNLDTGVSRTYNISGPTFKDGTLKGSALIGQTVDFGAPAPLLIVNHGQATFNSSGILTSLTGHQDNICSDLS
jgi:hypothetical protein